MNSTKTLNSQQRGVTMIEACITLAIAGILAGSALPSFKESLDKRRVEGLSSEVGTDLRYARSEAVRRRAGVLLQPASDGYSISSGSVLIKSVTFTSGLNFTESTVITFDQLRATSTPATMDLRNAAGTMRVRVSAMGRVALCAPGGNLSGYTAC